MPAKIVSKLSDQLAAWEVHLFHAPGLAPDEVSAGFSFWSGPANSQQARLCSQLGSGIFLFSGACAAVQMQHSADDHFVGLYHQGKVIAGMIIQEYETP